MDFSRCGAPWAVLRRRGSRAVRIAAAIAGFGAIGLSCGSAAADTTATLLQIKVTDGEGQPVPGAEVSALAEFGSPGSRVSLQPWQATGASGTSITGEGLPEIPYLSRLSKTTAYVALARAKGYAPGIVTVPAPVEGAAPPTVEIKLERGREIAIQLVPPGGKELPPDLHPILVPEDLLWQAWGSSKNNNGPETVNVVVPEPKGNGVFSFVINDHTPPLFALIHHPGFLRGWLAETPVSTTGTLAQPAKIVLPETVPVIINFENPMAAKMSADAVPLLDVTLLQEKPLRMIRSVPMNSIETAPGKRQWTVTDLPAGSYYFLAKEGEVQSLRVQEEVANTGTPSEVNLIGQKVLPVVVAVDESGTTLPEFQARLQSKGRMGGATNGWVSPKPGDDFLRFNRSDLSMSYGGTVSDDFFDVTVRAPGYAVGSAALEAGEPDAPPVIVKLNRGKTVRVQIRREDGKPLPPDLKPVLIGTKEFPQALFFGENPEQASSLGIGKDLGQGLFEFHVPASVETAYVAIHHRGFISHFASAELSMMEAKPLDVSVPPTGAVQVNVTITSPSTSRENQNLEGKYLVSVSRPFTFSGGNARQRYGTEAITQSTTTVFAELPPGEYEVGVTPVGGESLDKKVRVDSGSTATVALTAAPPPAGLDRFGRATPQFPAVHVTGEDDAVVTGAQVTVRKKSTSYLPTLRWTSAGADGLIKPVSDQFPDESTEGDYDLLVRAPGHVSSVSVITLPTSATEVPVKLIRGTAVNLELRDEEGRTAPEDLLPGVFVESWGRDVWLSARNDSYKTYKPERVLSPYAITRTGDGKYTVNIDGQTTEPLYVILYHPGYIRALQAGPIDPATWVSSGTFTMQVPKRAALQAKLDLNGQKPPSSRVTMELMHSRKVPGDNTWVLRLFDEELSPTSATLTAQDLAPGAYSVEMAMGPKNARYGMDVYSTRASANLEAGESKTLNLRYNPFQESWLKGPFTARVKILSMEGKPAAGADYKVTWYSSGYPTQTVASGKVPADGIVVLKDLAGIEKPATREEIEAEKGGVPSFSVSVGSSRLGDIDFFEYRDGKLQPLAGDVREKDFEFKIPPAEGDVAPDFEMLDIATSKTIRLSDFKGKVVLVDFWATWCGPCQGPMATNQDILRKYGEEWKDKVVILALSIDDELETVKAHLDKNKWHLTKNAWALPGPKGSTEAGWQAPATRLYGITGIPTLILIGSDGVIKSRGHIQDAAAAIQAEL